jgi:anti-sigma regulatory factor (Ser/Thr protein kinase)
MSFCEASDSRLRYVLPFEAVPAELGLLRRAVRAMLGQWGAAGVADEAELAVTEMATNVIKHVGEGVAATLVLEPFTDRVRLELHDKSHDVPEMGSPDCRMECGRGLHLLSSIVMAWGTLLTATGKAVWCEIALEPVRQCLRVQRAAAVLAEYRRSGGDQAVVIPSYAVLEDTATDIIADLLHWLAAQGGDPDSVLDRAQMHYEAEAA